MNKILVFGQNGQLARCLYDCKPAHVEAIFLGRLQVNFAENPDFFGLLTHYHPTCVINASAYTNVDKAEEEFELAFEINGNAVGALARVCAALNIPLLHISTDYVFDGNLPAEKSYEEEDKPTPHSAYGTSKLAGENAILASQGRHYIFRTAWVYSAYGKNFLKTMLTLAKTQNSLTIVNDQFGTPTAASDIAKTLWQATEIIREPTPPPCGIYHLVAKGSTTWHDFAQKIFAKAAKLGWSVSTEVEAIPSRAFPTPAKRPQNSQLNTNKLKQHFGIELPPWDERIDFVLKQLRIDKT